MAALLLLPALALPTRAEDRVTEALTQASKMLDKGIPVKAIEIINNALKGEKISGDLAAKALLLRAQAQEKLGKQAYALADYNSALWMQGLSERDKKEAEQGRDRILGKLGVSEPEGPAQSGQGRKAASAPGTDSSGQAPSAAARQAHSAAASGAHVQSSPSEQQTSGVGGFFSNLFNSSQAAQTPEPHQRATPPREHAERVHAQPAKVEPKPIAAVMERQSPRETGSVGSEPSGNFAIQFAALISEDGAIHEVNRIGKRYGEWLDGRTPSVKILGTKDGGTLYKVIAEPFERGQATATCELLKSKGVSCMIISR